MNIFVLDKDPRVAAEMACDKHVVKMILETAQLLCGVHHEMGTATEEMYRKTHINHPCAIWARRSLGNYEWLYEHFEALCDEYIKRYGKIHLTDTKLRELLKSPPETLFGGVTEFPQAMPEEYRNLDPVAAYRAYYKGEKANIAQWNKSKEPYWWKENGNGL